MSDKEPKLSKSEMKMKQNWKMSDAVKHVGISGWIIALLPLVATVIYGLDLAFDFEMPDKAWRLFSRFYAVTTAVVVLLDAQVLRTFFDAKRLSPGWWSFGTFCVAVISPIYMCMRPKYFKDELLKTKAKRQATMSVVSWGVFLFLTVVTIFVELNQAPKCWDPDVKRLFVNVLENSGLGDVKVGNVIEESQDGWVRTCTAFNVEYTTGESSEPMIEDYIIYTVQIVDGEDGRNILVNIPEQ